MSREMILTPEELYCLGVRMKAKYIDYAYIAAMKETGKDFAFFERMTRDSLIKKGVVEEDFGGNIEISDEAARLLTPVFFGEMETSVDMCKLRGKQKVSVNRFHFYNGQITHIASADGSLKVRALSGVEELRKIAEDLLPENFHFTEKKTVDSIEKDRIGYFYSVKSIVVGKVSSVHVFMEAEQELWLENENHQWETMTADAFAATVFDLIKGV